MLKSVMDFLGGKPQPVAPEKQLNRDDERFSRPLTEAGEGGPVIERPGAPVDQRLLRYYFEKFRKSDVHPVATDSFLGKSKDFYGPPWLARELIQNFVDANAADRGTLNGVKITSEKLKNPPGMRRFCIEGNWPFADATGLISPHSDKVQDGESAGGNGIGLKQVAIRLLRDYKVQKFLIEGEGWDVQYDLAKAEDINKDWRSQLAKKNLCPTFPVRHDWLLANHNESKNQGSCKYTIETDNPELIAILERLGEMGVSDTNPYLQNPDFENEHGAIKWLLIPEFDQKKRRPDSRLFMNGQVMSYQEVSSAKDGYWVGPDFMTIRLNNVKYKMNIDRPPVSSNDLDSYVDTLVNSMTRDELIEQLKRSEHLWTTRSDSRYGATREGCCVVIAKLVNKFVFNKKTLTPEEYETHFGGKKYLAYEYGLTDGQVDGLRKKGYIICPDYFSTIGMPGAKSKLEVEDTVVDLKPNFLAKSQMDSVAEEYGMEVDYENLDSIEPEAFFKLFFERLSPSIVNVESRYGKERTWRVNLSLDFTKQLLFHRLSKPSPEKADQMALHFLRGAVDYGLSYKLFEKVFLSQKEYVVNFGLDADELTGAGSLLVRNVKASLEGGVFLEMQLTPEAEKMFLQAEQKGKVDGVSSPLSPIEKVRKEIDGLIGGEENPALEPTVEKKEISPSLKPVRPVNSPEELKLVQKLGSIPIEQPTPPSEVQTGINVVEKAGVVTSDAKERIAAVEARIPEIRALVAALDGSIPEAASQSRPSNDPVAQYIEWRRSDNFYGQLGAESGYVSGKHLIEILASQSQAEISVVENSRPKSEAERNMERLNAELQTLANRIAPQEDHVDNFEIVLEPTREQLAQISLLRLYVEMTTGTMFPNDLFLYNGTGSKGININQKAIGLNVALFKVSFEEATSTFIHEVAHNNSMDHDPRFMLTMQALFSTASQRLSEIGLRALQRQETNEDKMILDIRLQWEKLKQGQAQ